MAVFEWLIGQENCKKEIIELIQKCSSGLGFLIVTLFDIALKHGRLTKGSIFCKINTSGDMP
jgi:hypothetical protein